MIALITRNCCVGVIYHLADPSAELDAQLRAKAKSLGGWEVVSAFDYDVSERFLEFRFPRQSDAAAFIGSTRRLPTSGRPLP